ncbi:MAG: glutamate synthase [Myxococcales bacterium]|nr:glutamate synthase [Myxococcales bacterium]
MAELRPYPFPALIRRMFAELSASGSIFDLPSRKFVLDPGGRDLSVRFHGLEAATPLGPAAGPHSQMAQNVVLAWLSGSRIIELKTVQINDTLTIPRPCIDMQTVGYNVEWSQELRLGESLVEYVKGAMLVEILAASGALKVAPGFGRVLYDMSVGYDLKGIQSDRVQEFIRGMLDATPVIEQLRAQIPDELARFRELDFQRRISNTLTLSTFHGCPPDEIESIICYLLDHVGLHCVVKLNPTLLGPEGVRSLLNERLGYRDVRVPDAAFERDTKWDQAVSFVERLGARAQRRGLGFGVKFSNTLICENHRDFFPKGEREMYLSGPPLHVIAMNLVGRFRARFGARYPISFSAGVDRQNFADAVALGLTPITVCSDFLKPGGYGRGHTYFKELDARMEAVGARDLEGFALLAYGHHETALGRVEGLDDDRRAAALASLTAGDDARARLSEAQWRAWVEQAQRLNTETYVARVTDDPRYGQARNAKPPRKVGSALVLFDCLTCDKCLPVCPNDANFRFVLPRGEVAVERLRRLPGGRWTVEASTPLTLEKKHQIGNFADFCNECGNCDVFCPEDGGPYVMKPRFFGSRGDWELFAQRDGFFLEREGATLRVYGRFSGRGYIVELDAAAQRGRDGVARYRGPEFALEIPLADPDAARGRVDAGVDAVDLTYLHIMRLVSEAVLRETDNYVVHLLDPAPASTDAGALRVTR